MTGVQTCALPISRASLEAVGFTEPETAPPTEAMPEAEQKVADIETPRQTELPTEESAPAKPPVESNGDSEPTQEKGGFFSRLLRRTDY